MYCLFLLLDYAISCSLRFLGETLIFLVKFGRNLFNFVILAYKLLFVTKSLCKKVFILFYNHLLFLIKSNLREETFLSSAMDSSPTALLLRNSSISLTDSSMRVSHTIYNRVKHYLTWSEVTWGKKLMMLLISFSRMMAPIWWYCLENTIYSSVLAMLWHNCSDRAS